MIPPELLEKISTWRRKVADKTITVEELQEAILAMRGARRSAQVVAKTSKKKSKGPERSVDDMLGELNKL